MEQTEQRKISDLVIRPQYLLGLELICPDGIARNRLIFEARRDDDDKQRWFVGVKRTPKQKPTDVAVFQKTPEAILFNWLPEAEKNRSAPFLQNCFVRLKTPDDQSVILSLRPPAQGSRDAVGSRDAFCGARIRPRRTSQCGNAQH